MVYLVVAMMVFWKAAEKVVSSVGLMDDNWASLMAACSVDEKAA